MQSWLFGAALQRIEPSSVELHSSRGYETASSKLLMRLTVLASDVLCRSPTQLCLSRPGWGYDCCGR
jgi:alpha-1,3-glucosyltransferase